MGTVLPHTSIKIAARDDPHTTLSRGEKGELLVAGYSVMKEYWQGADDTRATLVKVEETVLDSSAGGTRSTHRTWLRTGDEAIMEDDGTIRIVGRIKDIIIRAGENIYPPDIEDCLLQHPEISNASVVGLPDHVYGEVVAAFIIRNDTDGDICKVQLTGPDTEGLGVHELVSSTLVTTADDIRAWVRKHLSRHLVPKHIIWLDRLPLTASGKVEKFKLKALGAQWLRNHGS